MANQTQSLSNVSVASKVARIEIKTSPEVKQLLEQAARSVGVNLSAFIIGQAQENARRIMAETSLIRLNTEAWAILEGALQEPAPPTAALKDLIRRNRNNGPERNCSPPNRIT